MKKNKILTATLLIAATLIVATNLPLSKVHAATDLGGISVWNACVYQWGMPTETVIDPYNVMGWKCRYQPTNGSNVYRGVNLSKECVRTYGARAYADYTNFNDPFSWRCYR
jgi:hypothetical protein